LTTVGVGAGLVGGAFALVGMKIMQAAAGGVRSMQQLIKESLDLRTSIDSINNSLDVTATRLGYTTEELDGFETQLKSQGLTTSESLTILKQMTDGEMDLTKAQELVTLAQDASVVSGKTVAETLSTLIKVTEAQTEASLSQSARVSASQLKSMGIYVNFQAAYEAAALAQGKTTEQLTMTERRQIALNAVLSSGTQILGAYKDAQTDLSTVVKELPAYYEEVKYALGGAFEPIKTAAVNEWRDFLVKLVVWLRENQDEIDALGERIANFVEDSGAMFLDLMLKLVEALPKLITFIPDLATKIADMLAPAFGMTVEQLDAAGTELETFMKLVTMTVATTKGLIAVIQEAEATDKPFAVAEAMNNWFTGATTGVQNAEMDTFMGAFSTSFNELAKSYDLVGESADKAEDNVGGFTAAAAQQSVEMSKLSDAMTSANYDLTRLKDDLEEQEMDRQIQAYRDQVEASIRASWERQDIERQYAESVQSIYESSNESKLETARDYANSQVDIQRDLQEALKDLLEDFNFEASELARQRDAVGLLSLIRRNKRQVEDAKEAARESQESAREGYEEAIRSLDESVQKQLRKAAEARQKSYEALARSLAREAEMKALYNQWEEEDRKRALAEKLKDLWENFVTMDGMTQDGLDKLLADWGIYYTDLASLISMWNLNLNNAVSSAGMNAAGPGSIIPVEEEPVDTTPTEVDQGGHAAIIGQAGQVSSLLVNALDTTNLNRIPPVSPKSSRQSSDMHITVDGNGLDPYIQRVVANTLLEIERNRG
jgi:hypothetical protein